MTSVWAEGVARALGQALDLLAAAVRDCPGELWEAPMWRVPAPDPTALVLGPGGTLMQDPAAREALAQRSATPWGVAWHALEVFDYDLGGEFGPWSPPPPFAGHPHWRDLTVLPAAWTRDEILGYIDHCRKRAIDTLGVMSEERAARPLPAAHRYAGQPHAWVIGGLVGHTSEHAAQVRQFVAGMEAEPHHGTS
jgi:hypothetical protein